MTLSVSLRALTFSPKAAKSASWVTSTFKYSMRLTNDAQASSEKFCLTWILELVSTFAKKPAVSKSLRLTPKIRPWGLSNPATCAWYRQGSSLRIAKSPVAPNNTKSKFVCVLIVLSLVEEGLVPMPPDAVKDGRFRQKSNGNQSPASKFQNRRANE